jgi:hypothetical protein
MSLFRLRVTKMKVIKKGKIDKQGRISGFVFDCNGGPVNLAELEKLKELK